MGGGSSHLSGESRTSPVTRTGMNSRSFTSRVAVPVADEVTTRVGNEDAIGVVDEFTTRVGHEDAIGVVDEVTARVGNEDAIGVVDEVTTRVGNEDEIGVGNEDAIGVGDRDAIGVGDQDAIGVGDQDPIRVGDQDPIRVGDQDAIGVGDEDAVPDTRTTTGAVDVAELVQSGDRDLRSDLNLGAGTSGNSLAHSLSGGESLTGLGSYDISTGVRMLTDYIKDLKKSNTTPGTYVQTKIEEYEAFRDELEEAGKQREPDSTLLTNQERSKLIMMLNDYQSVLTRELDEMQNGHDLSKSRRMEADVELIDSGTGVGDVPLYLSDNHFLEGEYTQSLTAALDLCEKQVQVFDNKLRSVVIFKHSCTHVVSSMSPTTEFQLNKFRHILDILGAKHVDGLHEGVQIPSTLRNSVSFCFESLVGLARRFQQIADLLQKCSDSTIEPWYMSALELANMRPPKPRRWSEFSLAIRNYEWSMDLVNLAFHALETLLTLGTYTTKDASFRWCDYRCRMVLHIPGKYDSPSSSGEKHLLEVCRELEEKDLDALIQKLDQMVDSEPDKKRFYRPKSSLKAQIRIAHFLRVKLRGPTPELGKYYPDSIVFSTSDSDHFKFVEYLDKGSSGMVAINDWYGMKVAVKSVRGHGFDRTKFMQEAAILAMVQHPNVVRLIGCGFLRQSTTGPETALLVMELMHHDLRTVIDQRMRVLEGSSTSPFSPMVAIDLMQQIALAMQYLRSLNVLHRDLKAKNVLVNICKPLKTSTEVKEDSANTMLMAKPVSAVLPHTQENYMVKLADFGLAKCRPQTSWVDTVMVGTTGWRAPEVFNVPEMEVEQKYRWPADVYSFAMTSYEIVTGKLPFTPEEPRDGLHAKIVAGVRPSFDNLRPEFHAVRDLIQECWATDPADRPDFEYIVQKLWQCKVLAILPGFERKIMQSPSLSSGTLSSGRYPN